MSVRFPLDEMTIEEKLEAMEALWADLTRNQESFESPSWHEDVLQEREARLKAGEERFIDWETAKAQLRQAQNEDNDPSLSER